MARQNFAVEQGYDIHGANGNLIASQLAGTAIPGGDTGPQDAAPIGSLYQRTTGDLFRKTANAGATADWILMDQAAEADVRTQLTGVVAVPQILDSVLVDDVLSTEWEVHMRDDASPANVKVAKIIATHDGTASADASNVDDSVFAKLKIGSNFTADLDVEINGVGAAQVMRLSVTGQVGGVTFTARRNSIQFP